MIFSDRAKRTKGRNLSPGEGDAVAEDKSVTDVIKNNNNEGNIYSK